MSKLFYKTHPDAFKSGDDNGTLASPADGDVNEQHPLPIQLAWRASDNDEWGVVGSNAPLPVRLSGPVSLPEIVIENRTAVGADIDAAVAAASNLRCYGYSCKESAGTAAAATFRLIHGGSAGGVIVLETVELLANESRSEFWSTGIPCSNGISIDWIAGTVDVHIRYAVIS